MVYLEKIIGYCGIICSDCPVYKATQRNDDVERAEIFQRQRERWAEIFTKQYGREYVPEDINCDGCISESQRIFWFVKTCERRKCAQRKNLKNCAYCSEYPCESLSRLFGKYPKAKETLDEIKREINTCAR